MLLLPPAVIGKAVLSFSKEKAVRMWKSLVALPLFPFVAFFY
jgi:hypothetical protein